MNLGWLYGKCSRTPSPFGKIAATERRELLGVFFVVDDPNRYSFPGWKRHIAGQQEIQRRSAAAELTPINIRVLKLRYARDLTFQEIAVATGSTEDAVVQMHGRSIAKLRAELEQRGIRKKAHI